MCGGSRKLRAGRWEQECAAGRWQHLSGKAVCLVRHLGEAFRSGGLECGLGSWQHYVHGKTFRQGILARHFMVKKFLNVATHRHMGTHTNKAIERHWAHDDPMFEAIESNWAQDNPVLKHNSIIC